MASQQCTVTEADVAAGLALMERMNQAVIEGDNQAIAACRKEYSAILLRLNGGSNFGTYADENSPGCVMAERTASPDGQPPLWGQSGRFLIDVAGIKAIVTHCGFRWAGMAHLQFYAVELAVPFISTTGYMSYFVQGSGVEGLTVEEAAAAVFQTLLDERGLQAIERTESTEAKTDELAALPYVASALCQRPTMERQQPRRQAAQLSLF